MHESRKIFLVQDDIRAVLCSYDPDDKRNAGTICKTFDPDIREGDMVVVETDTRHRRTVVKVSEVDVEIDYESHTWVPWILAVVDEDAVVQIIEQEKALLRQIADAEKKAKRDELRAKLFSSHAEDIRGIAGPVTDDSDAG